MKHGYYNMRKAKVFGGIFLFSLIVFLLFPDHSFTKDNFSPFFAQKQLPLCWTPQQLRQKRGENKIYSRVEAAFRTPPNDPFTPSPPPTKQWKNALGKVIRRVNLPKGVKKIALTFDLCEQPHEIAGYQGKIVDLLRKERVHATFFSGGKWLLTHEQRAQQLMSDPLFEIANHSWEHRNLRLLKGKQLTNTIRYTQSAYSHIRNTLTGRQCRRAGMQKAVLTASKPNISLFRFPFGACDKASIKAVGQAGLLSIQWDIAAGDPVRGQSARRIKRTVLNRAKPGSIVIFHANGRGWHTPKALPAIIRSLKKQGYQFVTVSQLLNSKGAQWQTTDRCYDHHPGDSTRYDKVGRRLNAFYNRVLKRRSRPKHRLRTHSPRSRSAKRSKHNTHEHRRKTKKRFKRAKRSLARKHHWFAPHSHPTR